MHRCPICKKEVTIEAPARPFCSDRCKQIDLGRWLNEEYRISRPMTEDEVANLPDFAALEGDDGQERDQS